MRKSLVLITSGQDSAAILYDTLKNTDDQVYARFIRFRYHYSKNDMDFAEPYILNIVNWCKENIRDFDFDIELAENPHWSFQFSPEDRVYDQLPKRVLDKYEDYFNGSPFLTLNGSVCRPQVPRCPDGQWACAKIAEKLKVDAVIIGRDIIQELYDIGLFYNIGWDEVVSQNWKQYDDRHTYDLISFWHELTDIPIEAPLAYKYRMSRLSIYDMLPNELRLQINPCKDHKRKPEWYFRGQRLGTIDNWCEDCISCLTRIIYETKVYTPEETEQIFSKYFQKNWVETIVYPRHGYTDCLSKMLAALESPEDMEEFRNDFSIEISE